MGSSPTRARTRVPCIGKRILNHCAIREAHHFALINTLHPIMYSCSCCVVACCLQPVWKPTGIMSLTALLHPLEFRDQCLANRRCILLLITVIVTNYHLLIAYYALNTLYFISQNYLRDRYFYLHYANWGSEKLNNLSQVTELLGPWGQEPWESGTVPRLMLRGLWLFTYLLFP